jgi:ubiquinol-cytochrome c reductase cytochrome b subunit
MSTLNPVQKLHRGTDERFGASNFIRKSLNKVFPDHWSFLLGEIALYSFIVLLISGTYLTLFFDPSQTETVYHGSYAPLEGVPMSLAYASTVHLSFDVRAGLVFRQIHHWAALLFVASIIIHLMRVFFTGAFRKPREINWLIGVTLLVLALLEGFAGYSLPDDLLSGTGLRIMYSVIESIPVVGTWLGYLFFGGEFPGTGLIPRLYVVHILLVPGILLALISAHLGIMWHQKHTQFAGPGRTEHNVVGHRMFPHFAAKSGGFFMLVFGMSAALGGLAQINPVWLYGPYTPLAISAASQPDFYLGILDGALRIMPPWEWNFLGHTISFSLLIPFVVPLGVILGGAALWPFFERWATGDKAFHNINDRPRNAPVRTGVGIAAVTFYGVLWAESANDVIADQFHVPLYTLTWIARVLVVVGPPAAFFLTRRICIGLQRKDAELLEHGMETGIIRQLPDGRFIEEHRPLTEQERAPLQDEKVPALMPGPGSHDGNGVPAPQTRGLTGRVRAIANRAFAETAAFQPDGHGNGNGHAPGGHAVAETDPAASPSPGRQTRR